MHIKTIAVIENSPDEGKPDFLSRRLEKTRTETYFV